MQQKQKHKVKDHELPKLVPIQYLYLRISSMTTL